MKDCFTYSDCVARYEPGEIQATEWEGYPLYHSDPLWNAALFEDYYDHGQEVTLTNKNELVIHHDVPSCHEDLEMGHVTATFHANSDRLYVYVSSYWASRAIWIGPSAARELRDYLNSNPF